MSGAGKTQAADWFEDQGYYCIDNMPPTLIKNFLELSASDTNRIEKVAFVTDVRGGEFFEELETCIDELKSNDSLESMVLYLEASNASLVRRFNETRRNHPLTGGKATYDVIEDERLKLKPVRKRADMIIDTTNMKTSDFYLELGRIFLGNESANAFSINISSFGYKYGIPTESDMLIDVRFIPNPFYVSSLKKLTGNNKKVSSYVLKFDITKDFIKGFVETVNRLIPGYINEGKYHLNIAFGCTGGHHRSVAVANEVARIFKEEGKRVTVTHRDLDFVSKGSK
jgi:UPF0042 nucleotide-binding protein